MKVLSVSRGGCASNRGRKYPDDVNKSLEGLSGVSQTEGHPEEPEKPFAVDV